MAFTGKLGDVNSQLGNIQLGVVSSTVHRLYASPAGLGSFLLFGSAPLSLIGAHTAGEATTHAAIAARSPIAAHTAAESTASALTAVPVQTVTPTTAAEATAHAQLAGQGTVSARTVGESTAHATIAGVVFMHAATEGETSTHAAVTGSGVLQVHDSGQAWAFAAITGPATVHAAGIGEAATESAIVAFVVLSAYTVGESSAHASIRGVVSLEAVTSGLATTHALIEGHGFIRLEVAAEAASHAHPKVFVLGGHIVGETVLFAAITGVTSLIAHVSAQATTSANLAVHKFITGFGIGEESAHVVLSGHGVLIPRTVGESHGSAIPFGVGFLTVAQGFGQAAPHIILVRVPYSTSTRLLFVHFERSNVRGIRFWNPIRDLEFEPIIRRLIVGGPRLDEEGILRRMPTTADRDMPRSDTLFFLDSVWQDVATQQVFTVPITNPTTPPPPGSVPFNLSGSRIICTVKKYVPDPDQAAVMQMDNESIGGVAIISAVQGTFSVTGPAEATVQFPDSEVELPFDIQLITVSGNVITVERGKLFVHADVTRAPF